MKRQKYSKTQWMERMTVLLETLPREEIDDLSIFQMLLEIIVTEQGRMSDESLAVLVGLATTTIRKAVGKVKPSNFSPSGKPLFTEKDVANVLGVPPDMARKLIVQLKREQGDEPSLNEGVATVH